MLETVYAKRLFFLYGINTIWKVEKVLSFVEIL